MMMIDDTNLYSASYGGTHQSSVDDDETLELIVWDRQIDIAIFGYNFNYILPGAGSTNYYWCSTVCYPSETARPAGLDPSHAQPDGDRQRNNYQSYTNSNW